MLKAKNNKKDPLRESKRKAERKLMNKMGGGTSEAWIKRKQAIKNKVAKKEANIKEAIRVKKEKSAK